MRRSTVAVLAVFVAALSVVTTSRADDKDNDPVLTFAERLAEQEEEIAAQQETIEEQAEELEELRESIESLTDLYGPVESSDDSSCDGGLDLRRLPVVAEDCWKPGCDESEDDGPKFQLLHFYADYDGGFMIRPFCPEKHPFELKINLWTQVRHHGFTRHVPTWTDNAGVTRTVRNRNAFDIERARLVFSGYALDKRLTYFVHLDGDSDGGHVVDFFDHWWAWKFSDRFRLQLGKRKVTASRQWLLGARRTRLVDRPMSNDFFRPDRTIGLFALGRIGETGYYEAMVGNGYRTSNIPNSGTDDQLTFAVTNYFDPWGKYGGQIVDYDYTCDPLLRIGHSFVYAPNTSENLGTPLREVNFIRLSDGTQLSQTGALAAGVTVSDFDIYFYGADLAFKWRGWSANAEVFFRWIQEINGNGALPLSKLMQRGFYVEGGRFIIPKKLDINARYSQVSGLFGDATEIAGGINWYPLDHHKMKFSFDVTALDGSPLQNTTTDILVGDDGLLFRTQFQVEF